MASRVLSDLWDRYVSGSDPYGSALQTRMASAPAPTPTITPAPVEGVLNVNAPLDYYDQKLVLDQHKRPGWPLTAENNKYLAALGYQLPTPQPTPTPGPSVYQRALDAMLNKRQPTPQPTPQATPMVSPGYNQ